MSLTHAEELRIERIEDTLSNLTTTLAGAASKDMLNRLLALCNEELRKTGLNITRIETKQNTLISLAQKLQ